jgi:hypothetical protein
VSWFAPTLLAVVGFGIGSLLTPLLAAPGLLLSGGLGGPAGDPGGLRAAAPGARPVVDAVRGGQLPLPATTSRPR